VLFATLALCAAVARAQSPSPPAGPRSGSPPADAATDARVREARALYERGVRHFHLAEYDAAIDLFKAAYRTSEAPGFLYNIALAYRMKGDCAQALHFYRMYLRLEPAAPNRPEVEARIEEQRRCALAAAQAASRPAPATQPAAPTARAGLGAAPDGRPAVAAGRVDPARPSPPPPRGRLKRGFGLATAGAGVVLVAVAAAYGAKAHGAADTINGLFRDGGQWDAHYRSVEADGRRASDLALGLSIAGGVALLGGATLYYLGWRERRWRPILSLHGRGATASLACEY
jgi:tetratricopeptide (TPR) repeat protein